MNRLFTPIALIIVAIVVAVLNTFFIVRQDRQAIVLRFGEFTSSMNVEGVGEPGVYAKAPLIDSVIFFDKRNLGLTLEGQPIVAADQERLIVDAFVRWRIVDPLRFYQAAQSESGGAQRMESFLESAMRRALGSATSNDIISGRRAALMQAIEDDLNASVASELGVSIIDVRIRQADLPPETQARVYDNMRTEREQEAGRIRAEGREAAARIRADADREVIVVRATAQEQAEQLRGRGDAERARLFAAAYGKDADFAEFYRSMRAYEVALDNGTPLVLSPNSDFFRYMRNRQGGR